MYVCFYLDFSCLSLNKLFSNLCQKSPSPLTVSVFFFNKFIYFIILFYFFGCVGSSLLRVGFSLVAVHGLLIAVASLVGGARASVVVALGLSSCGARV